MSVARLLTVLFSLCLHVGMAGILYFFSGDIPASGERVYHVSLAEVAGEDLNAANPDAPGLPPAEAPAPEVAPSSPEAETAGKPEVNVVSPTPKKEAESDTQLRKKRRNPAEGKQTSSSAPAAETQAPGGVNSFSGNMGGVDAYQLDAVDERPSIVKRVVPEYPDRAHRLRVEGKVDIQIVVDVSGHPK
ncbi:MAG: hypothetical protein LBC94_06380 [Desulfovibrio sp.]|jgi:protein TonB|nr:hypothetical protein [Desulfovibrio sp.]